MRIINWNVERPSIRSPKNTLRVQHIQSLDPDIVVLTETSTAVDLGNVFASTFTSPSPRKPRKGEAVAAIWVKKSRFTIVDEIATSDPREAVCVELDADGVKLLVYASIISYHGYKGPDRSSARWEEHEKSIQWHANDWMDLRNRFPDHHLMTAGDYNQHLDGVGKYGNKKIREQLTTAISAAGMKCVTKEDFVSTQGLSRRNIDHVCMTQQLAKDLSKVTAWEGTVDGTRLSDHNGITVDLQLQPY